MRRGFSSLGGLVQSTLDKSPLSGQVFIFRDRRGDLVKLIGMMATGCACSRSGLIVDDLYGRRQPAEQCR
jgi:transposase